MWSLVQPRSNAKHTSRTFRLHVPIVASIQNGCGAKIVAVMQGRHPNVGSPMRKGHPWIALHWCAPGGMFLEGSTGATALGAAGGMEGEEDTVSSDLPSC